MKRDESMLSVAAYFWSDTLNTFLFGQGPMTPTLLDVVMITGLDVTSVANPISLDTKGQFSYKTRAIGGWTGFITDSIGTSSVTPREHTTFLMMWLENFLFCGPSCGPTLNWQHLAEALVEKRLFPLGKSLLGALYQTLGSASARIAVDSVIGTGGPWWLLQMWLTLQTIKMFGRPALDTMSFPTLEPIEDDEGDLVTTRWCMSFGEATSAYLGSVLSAEQFSDWFSNFHDGFPRNSRTWFAYEHFEDFELPIDFRFDEINHERFEKSRMVLTTAISPCILPIGIHQGRKTPISYEFYHPMSAARQLGLGQLPIVLFFTDKIQTRG